MQKFLTAPATKTSKSTVIFWFSLSLTFAAIYGIMALQQAFSAEYVVQDDARQHTFWMQRFIDRELFPGDLIADYFQAVAPAGYTALYQLMAALGIAPLLLSKWLPSVLGLITTGYCFGISMQLLPVPMAAFISTLLLNQYLWMRDDLVSATAVAFVYPLFVAFIYYLLRRQLIGTCVAIALLGLFYPQGVFICAGILILQLVQWEKQPLKGVATQTKPADAGFFKTTKAVFVRVAAGFSLRDIRDMRSRSDYQFCAAGLGVAILVMSLYALKSHGYGPVISAAEAKTLPEFLPGGLSKFFVDNFWHFWITGQRSGIMPRFGTLLPLFASILLPPILLYSAPFPLVKELNKIAILLQIIVASLGMFLVSHALLFKLHLPSRYTEHSLRVVTALAGAIALTVIIDAIFVWAKRRNIQWLALGFAGLLLTALMLNPSFLKRFPRSNYIVGEVPKLYQFFQNQPKDILIVSLAREANNLPIFSQRSILVGAEGYPVPYHKGYYKKIRDRAIDLIEAQYSPDLQQLRGFIDKYGIDFWVVEKSAFAGKYLASDRWIMQYQPAANQAIALLDGGKIPAISGLMKSCSVLEVKEFVVLRASCMGKE